MAARRGFLKNRVRRMCRWPFSLDIMFYNDRERHRLQSDGEGKHYKQVCYSYANIKPIFPMFYAHFSTFSVITLVFEFITSSLTADL